METINLAIPRGAKIGPDARPIYGYEEVTATGAGGLAVHKAVGKGNRWRWTVTHVETGLCLERIGAMTKKGAMENMRRALDLPVDWTLPEAEIFRALREDRRLIDGLNAIANRD